MTEDQNTIANQVQTESIVKKILTSEVKYILGIVVFLVGVVAPYYDIKTEIALIKQNHYAHIEQLTKEMAANTEEIKDLKKTEVTLMGVIADNSARIKVLEK
jgi:cell division protein FtsB